MGALALTELTGQKNISRYIAFWSSLYGEPEKTGKEIIKDKLIVQMYIGPS